jgi:hypothetical protein
LLSPSQIQDFYVSKTLTIPSLWNASRKHFRVEFGDSRFVKLLFSEPFVGQRLGVFLLEDQRLASRSRGLRLGIDDAEIL